MGGQGCALGVEGGGGVGAPTTTRHNHPEPRRPQQHGGPGPPGHSPPPPPPVGASLPRRGEGGGGGGGTLWESKGGGPYVDVQKCLPPGRRPFWGARTCTSAADLDIGRAQEKSSKTMETLCIHALFVHFGIRKRTRRRLERIGFSAGRDHEMAATREASFSRPNLDFDFAPPPCFPKVQPPLG